MQSSEATTRVQINGTTRVAQSWHIPKSISVWTKSASVDSLVTLIALSSLLVRSTRAIKRVIGIDRVAVDTNIEAITPQLDLPFRRVVARLTKTLQRPGDELR
jgi:hypothetical protein